MKGLRLLIIAFAMALANTAFGSDVQCDAPCTVTVCSADTCTVYRCDANSCVVVGTYPYDSSQKAAASNVVVHDDSGEVRRGKSCYSDRCAFKVCDDEFCTAYGFVDGVAVPLASIETSDSVLDTVIEDFLSDQAEKSPEAVDSR